MIDVRVRQHNRVDGADRSRERLVLSLHVGPPTLKQSAIKQDGLPEEADNVAGACYFARSAEELDFHKW